MWEKNLLRLSFYKNYNILYNRSMPGSVTYSECSLKSTPESALFLLKLRVCGETSYVEKENKSNFVIGSAIIKLNIER